MTDARYYHSDYDTTGWPATRHALSPPACTPPCDPPPERVVALLREVARAHGVSVGADHRRAWRRKPEARARQGSHVALVEHEAGRWLARGVHRSRRSACGWADEITPRSGTASALTKRAGRATSRRQSIRELARWTTDILVTRALWALACLAAFYGLLMYGEPFLVRLQRRSLRRDGRPPCSRRGVVRHPRHFGCRMYGLET